jgi:hypothetical protein
MIDERPYGSGQAASSGAAVSDRLYVSRRSAFAEAFGDLLRGALAGPRVIEEAGTGADRPYAVCGAVMGGIAVQVGAAVNTTVAAGSAAAGADEESERATGAGSPA